MDVETAFLNASLDTDIYIKMPEDTAGELGGKILLLKKSLYGLKQAGRNWNKTLVAELVKLGYEALFHSDPCILIRTSSSGGRIIFAIFVDDMLFIYQKSDEKEANSDKTNLMKCFSIKDLG